MEHEQLIDLILWVAAWFVASPGVAVLAARSRRVDRAAYRRGVRASLLGAALVGSGSV